MFINQRKIKNIYKKIAKCLRAIFKLKIAILKNKNKKHKFNTWTNQIDVKLWRVVVVQQMFIPIR